MDKDINELRNEINSIDREFVELFYKAYGSFAVGSRV